VSASSGLPEPDPISLADTAARWTVRRREGLSVGEEEELRAWLETDSAHRAAFEESLRGWEAAGLAAGDPRLRAMRRDALKARPRRLSGLPLAASLAALALAGGTTALLFRPGPSAVQSEAGRRGASSIYETAVGERSTVRLEDGSVVTLNTNSRLKVSYSRAERDIALLAGQALFQVAHDSKRPFIVSALDRQVVATGTIFDVRIDREAVRVALVQGRVVVRALPTLAARAQVTAKLEPGEELVATAGSPAEISAADVDRLTSWREGRVRFADTPLTEAVAEMNRYSTTPIVIEDGKAGAIRISGAFETGRSKDFAAAVASLFPVKAREADGEIRLRSAS
jgi:transmembrane sensor